MIAANKFLLKYQAGASAIKSEIDMVAFFSLKKYFAGNDSRFFSTLSLLALLIVGNFVIANPALALWTIHENIYFRCPLSTKEAKITDNDKIAIRVVIQNQIEAFRAGDGERAFLMPAQVSSNNSTLHLIFSTH